MYTQSKYLPDEFESTPVQTFVGADIYGFTGAETSKRITKSEIESNERFINPGWFSTSDASFYGVEAGPWELSGQSGTSRKQLVLQVWAPQETTFYSREIYNILDFLGDIGGLFDALKIIGGSIIGVFGSSGL